MDARRIEAMAKVIEYMKEEERNHYQESEPEAQAAHIWNSIEIMRETVRDWCDHAEAVGQYSHVERNQYISDDFLETTRARIA